MTRNQLQYHANREIARHNLVEEDRKNLELEETRRSHLANESIQSRQASAAETNAEGKALEAKSKAADTLMKAGKFVLDIIL